MNWNKILLIGAAAGAAWLIWGNKQGAAQQSSVPTPTVEQTAAAAGYVSQVGWSGSAEKLIQKLIANGTLQQAYLDQMGDDNMHGNNTAAVTSSLGASSSYTSPTTGQTYTGSLVNSPVVQRDINSGLVTGTVVGTHMDINTGKWS